jgi:CRP-like cAMP-binding protein
MKNQNRFNNRILAQLPQEDFQRLRPYLEAVDLPLRTSLEVRNKRVRYVYFIENGFASVVANTLSNRSTEIAIIGREGMTGLSIIMGVDRTPHDTYMQYAGNGYRMPAETLRQRMVESAPLHFDLLGRGYAYVLQTANTATANSRSNIEERLGRWLLMAHDRIDGDTLSLTHEFLSIMLSVRRVGVTVALGVLADEDLIRARRGAITIIDRKGLEKRTNGAYGIPEAEYHRLFG